MLRGSDDAGIVPKPVTACPYRISGKEARESLRSSYVCCMSKSDRH